MIEFTAIQNTPQATSLLTLDDVNVLIDPGCDALLKYENSTVPDIILLSHSDPTHLGGYVYGYRHLGWNGVPVFATLPVVNMGRTTMYDALKSILPQDITMADIDDAFDSITALRYAQATPLSGKCQGIVLSAHNAGHSLGGTIWKVVRGSDNIVFASDWNHARDQHLNGAALFSGGMVPENLSRPTVLITDAYKASALTVPRSKRITALFESIETTLRNSGSVLLPIDSSTRSLELCELLENHWRATESLKPIPVYFLSYSNTKAIGYARSMLEWMSEKMINDYGSSGGLFDFQHIRLLSKSSQVGMLAPGPKVILATSSDLDSGFSQQVLRTEIAASPSNLVILTQESTYSQESLAGTMMSQWQGQTKDATGIAEHISLDLQTTISVRKNVPLEGEELSKYNQQEQARRDEEYARTAMEERNRNILDADDSESEDEDERAVLAAQGVFDRSLANTITLGSSALLATSFDVYLEDPRLAKLPPRLKSFPFVEKRRRFDDYGEVLRPDEFKRADEEETEAENVEDKQKTKAATGQKRSWNEMAEIDAADIPDEVDDARTIPSKLEISQEDLRIRCRMRYIDMEGLHDGTSLKNIVESINPRQLVLVHASERDKQDMKQSCEAMKGFTKSILIPEMGSKMEISLDTNAYEVVLTDALAGSLHWQKLYEQEVAHVIGKLVPRSEEESELPPLLDVLSGKDEIENVIRTQSLFVGDVRLTDLRQALAANGKTAELRGGGVLMCDGIVSVTKAAAGEVLLEGQSSDLFALVRSSIYSSLAVITE